MRHKSRNPNAEKLARRGPTPLSPKVHFNLEAIEAIADSTRKEVAGKAEALRMPHVGSGKK
jgi:hypothetical protein